MPSRRFVILHHRTRLGDHWDLMIEQADSLATWKLALDPILHAGKAIGAERIVDHRKAYLDLQGPIGNDRGDVTRIERGTCEIAEADPSRWLIRLAGRRIQGSFELVADAADVDAAEHWIFRPTTSFG